MFNWTTTTIVNSLKDFTTGLPLVTVWSKGEQKTLSDGTLPAEYGMAGTDASAVVKIKRDHTFEARWVRSIYKAIGHEHQVCELTIDADALLTAVKDAYAKEGVLEEPVTARLSFYVTLEGSEESIYANDWYQKGKPFSIGFDILPNDTAEKIAKKIKRNAEKFGIVTYGKKIFDLSLAGSTLTLKGTHEYQRIAMAAVAVDEMIDERIVAFYGDNAPENEDQDVFALVHRGVNGFGTYHQLTKDLRLPTPHNYKPLKVKKDENPVVGALYNQYIITYCAPSMANPGFTVVGQHNMSVTTHVFWVLQDIADEFEESLAVLHELEEVAVEVEEDEDGNVTITGPESNPVKDAPADHVKEIDDVKE